LGTRRTEFILKADQRSLTICATSVRDQDVNHPHLFLAQEDERSRIETRVAGNNDGQVLVRSQPFAKVLDMIVGT
jgi:hypothetical protein